MQGRRRGFTLIELLIVIGMITLLAGILLPVIALSREHAWRGVCLNNQKNIYGALILFYNANDESFPGSSGNINGAGTSPWTSAHIGVGQLASVNDSLPQATVDKTCHSILVGPYLASSAVFHCPQQDVQGGLEQGYFNSQVVYEYVFNQYFVGDQSADPTTFLPVFSSAYPTCRANGHANTMHRCNPSNCVLITESVSSADWAAEFVNAGSTTTFLWAWPIHGRRPFGTNRTNADYANCIYVDGHGASVKVDMTNPAAYGVPSDDTGLQH